MCYFYLFIVPSNFTFSSFSPCATLSTLLSCILYLVSCIHTPSPTTKKTHNGNLRPLPRPQSSPTATLPTPPIRHQQQQLQCPLQPPLQPPLRQPPLQPPLRLNSLPPQLPLLQLPAALPLPHNHQLPRPPPIPPSDLQRARRLCRRPLRHAPRHVALCPRLGHRGGCPSQSAPAV